MVIGTLQLKVSTSSCILFQVFRRIYERLLQQGIIQPTQVHTPSSLPTDQDLALVHCPEYLAAFSSCTLDNQRVRRCVISPAVQSYSANSEVHSVAYYWHLRSSRGHACGISHWGTTWWQQLRVQTIKSLVSHAWPERLLLLR